MVGEINVAIADQQVTVIFLVDHVVFRFDDYRSARLIRAIRLPGLKQIAKLLSFGGIGLQGQIGNQKPFELFPQPRFFVRWLSPAVRILAREASISHQTV